MKHLSSLGAAAILAAVAPLAANADVAGDGLAVLEKVARKNYDLILLDCHMPNLDGYETAKRLRASPDPAIQKTRIIALTASALQGDRERCLAVGMNDYVSKPISLDDLRGAITRQLLR